MDTKQIKIRLAREDSDTLDRLAGGLLSRQQMAAMLLGAACGAVRGNDYRLSFPPVLSVLPASGKDTEVILKMNPPKGYKSKQ